jgi:hypothetical protein
MSTPTDTKPEEIPEPIEKAGPVVPEPDEHGWVHIGHDHPKDAPVAAPNCGAPCYEVAH